MANELIFYKTPNGEQRIEVIYLAENFWMSQRALAELFGVKRPAITKHLGNIFSTGELVEAEVSSILETTTQHGAIAGKTQSQQVKHYNLDAIIAVGYRVNSYQATQFRIWATKTLKEFVIKGFVMDDERLKQGKQFPAVSWISRTIPYWKIKAKSLPSKQNSKQSPNTRNSASNRIANTSPTSTVKSSDWKTGRNESHRSPARSRHHRVRTFVDRSDELYLEEHGIMTKILLPDQIT